MGPADWVVTPARRTLHHLGRHSRRRCSSRMACGEHILVIPRVPVALAVLVGRPTLLSRGHAYVWRRDAFRMRELRRRVRAEDSLPNLTRACRDRLPSRRRDPAGFTRSSTMASGSWRTGTATGFG